MTTIYHYDPQTGEYLHESVADTDPLEGQPLIPAFATTKVPPAMRQNEAAVFDGALWKIVPDYRGMTYWLADKSRHSIDRLDWIPPDDALDAPPPPTLDELKADASRTMLKLYADGRAAVAGHIDFYQLSGWVDKAPRAQRVLAGTASDTDIAILQAECDARGKGETPQALAQIQVEKGKILATAAAIIDGMESASLEAIEGKRTAHTLDTLLTELKQQADSELTQLLGQTIGDTPHA